MRYRPLGRGGPLVSEIGFGAWQIGGHGWTGITEESSKGAVARALELGVTLFDTADVYGLGTSERLLAEALGPRRHEVVIATKYGVRIGEDGASFRDASPAHLRRALEASLVRLRLDRIPLYQVHWPDGTTPLAAILDALEAAREAGLIAHYGLSNFSPDEVRAAAGRPGLVSLQFRYNLLDADEMAPTLAAVRETGLGGLAHSALAQGLLGGRLPPEGGFPPEDVRSRSAYFRGDALAANVSTARRVIALAESLGRTPAQVALRWVLDSPGITSALCGCKTAAQVDENCGVDFSLDRHARASLETPSGAAHG